MCAVVIRPSESARLLSEIPVIVKRIGMLGRQNEVNAVSTFFTPLIEEDPGIPAMPLDIVRRSQLQSGFSSEPSISESLQEQPFLKDYLRSQIRRLQRRISEVDRLVESPFTYMSDRKFAKAYLRAVTLKLRLKRFGRWTNVTFCEMRITHNVLVERVLRPSRKHYAISTSRHLSKFTDTASRRNVLERLNQDILVLSFKLFFLEEQILPEYY